MKILLLKEPEKLQTLSETRNVIQTVENMADLSWDMVYFSKQRRIGH